MASPRTSSSITGLVHSYLEDIHRENASFFKQLANKPQINGRIFFNLVLDNGTTIAFPNDESTTALLMRANTSSIDKLTNPRLTLSTVDIIQRNAADIFSMVRVSFLEKLTDLTPDESDELHRILAGALCYKIWCLKNTSNTNIVKAKIIAAVLSSPEDSSNTLHTLSERYSEILKNKFTRIFNSIDEYLISKTIKLLDAVGNLNNAIQDLHNNSEYRCLNDDDQHQIHRHINFKLKQLKACSVVIKLNKQDREALQTALSTIQLIHADDKTYAANIDALASTKMHKGLSIGTSTPTTAASANKPSSRKQLTNANLPPRSAAAGTVSVALSPAGFMSRASVMQPKKAIASPRTPSKPVSSPRQ